jgi:biopolymer transport protein ExbD
VKINITSMMDMFTIILVFLLKNFSTQGQLATPASGLVLPVSSIERPAAEALSVKISAHGIMVENQTVVDEAAFKQLLEQNEYMIDSLFAALHARAVEAKKAAQAFNETFSGKISIQGDVAVPYRVLTRVMYTCGQAGYPVMNLVVYREG